LKGEKRGEKGKKKSEKGEGPLRRPPAWSFTESMWGGKGRRKKGERTVEGGSKKGR